MADISPVLSDPAAVPMLQRRRSVPPPLLAEPGPDAAEIETLLAIAARVPDHGKLAPWRFIVFEGEGRLRAGERLAAIQAEANPAVTPARLDVERKRFAQAPVVVAVVSRAAPHPKIPEWEQILSAGAVAMNLTVAAVAMGFGTSWITEWPAYESRAKAALGLSETENIVGFIHIGTPTSVPEDRVRPVMADLVTRF